MIVRKAHLHDIQSIYQLISSATKRGKILKRTLEDIQKTVRHFWVIEEKEKVVACCALEIYNKKLAEVRSLVVAQSRQRNGLATLLLRRCLRDAKKKEIYEVLAITDRLSLFKRLGFSEQLHGQKPLFLRTR